MNTHVNRHLGVALNNGDDYIQYVIVKLSDINGPRGGADKCCYIQVVLPGLPDVVIEDTESDLYVAIDRAADRAGRTVTRRVARKRHKSRSFRKHDMKTITDTEKVTGSNLT